MTEVAAKIGEQGKSFLSGGGEVGALMRSKDWSVTPLGVPETWSVSIKTAVDVCLQSRFPILLWLGPELQRHSSCRQLCWVWVEARPNSPATIQP